MSGTTVSVWLSYQQYNEYGRGQSVYGSSVRNERQDININVPRSRVKNMSPNHDYTTIQIRDNVQNGGQR
jgi:hypothetical protein